MKIKDGSLWRKLYAIRTSPRLNYLSLAIFLERAKRISGEYHSCHGCCGALFCERKGDAANGNPRCLLPIILVTLTDKILDAVVARLPEIERKSGSARVIAV